MIDRTETGWLLWTAKSDSTPRVDRSPCDCQNWVRGVMPEQWYGRTRDGIPRMTNHHPNCPHYNDSLIDVWKMTVNGVSAYTDSEQDIIDWRQDELDDETTITKEKMHREIFEQLPEFEGF